VASELDEIAELYGGKVLEDRQFVIPEVEQSLARIPYSVVHIASHGEFAGDPEDSFLLTYDGRLDMNELEQLIKLSRFRDEPIELLTLSACRTAAGDDRAALGLAGVAVKAGARSALATLWFINDQASSLLVTEFYRQLAAKPTPSKAKALQLAQRAIKGDPRYRHPAYWSPFLMIGNWL
jgi:CHAT domain-containing protein